MPTEPRTDSWWEPTWRRLVGSTVVLFLVILAFLVVRVRAGADPGLAREATGTATQQEVAPPSNGSGADPADPFGSGTPQTDPGANGSTDDNFGNAVPDQSGGQGFDDHGGGGQAVDPPSTHVS
jgi:hypothetical protein